MKENNIIKLGFKKVNVTAEESGDKSFFYYVLDICNGLSFISNSNDEVINDNWYVELFNTEIPIQFTKYKQLKKIIKIINKCIKDQI